MLALGLAAVVLLSSHECQLAPAETAEELRRLDPRVLSPAERETVAGLIERDLARRRERANAANRAEWNAISSRQQWEAYRNERMRRLWDSLGEFPPPPETFSDITGVVRGAGFQIENLVYRSRPGHWVPGNLYVPAEPRPSMPGILIVHSHHRDKSHGELQDMGMTWARAGCLVLVIDQVGYGERRAHPFHGPDDFAGDYPSGRQDYYYRYDSGIQLQLVGDSLMGWFVWDLMRGVDLLLSRAGVDPQRIIVLGAVAGGGDPCAITAALDSRVSGAVPFNFGGLQPESYPLPENADETFNFAMSSYWDSTRGLPRTCSEGFFHWTIVGALAPRPLIYAHEFQWDEQHDPAWKRFRRIYDEFYQRPEQLESLQGQGSVRLPADAATHCTHIGKYHRQFIHPAFQRWFGIQVTSADEYSQRVDATQLVCMTPDFRRRFEPRDLPALLSHLGETRLTAARKSLWQLPPASRREALQRGWSELLGTIEAAEARMISVTRDETSIPGLAVDRVLLRDEEHIAVPLLLLAPTTNIRSLPPVVVAVAQAGKAALLSERHDQVAQLLANGFAVCLPDLRGTGETQEGATRGRTSGDTNRSVNMQMFGETILGQRLRDLRTVLRYLRTRDDLDASRLALWGDSLVEPNPAETDFHVPHGVERSARQPEPLGGLLALLAGLYEDLKAVYIHRGLASYLSVLHSPHVYLPHDAAAPRVLRVGDLADLTAAIAHVPVRWCGAVDGLNRPVDVDDLRERLAQAFESQTLPGSLSVVEIPDPAAWFREVVGRE